jgi:hypothetical protein
MGGQRRTIGGGSPAKPSLSEGITCLLARFAKEFPEDFLILIGLRSKRLQKACLFSRIIRVDDNRPVIPSWDAPA